MEPILDDFNQEKSKVKLSKGVQRIFLAILSILNPFFFSVLRKFSLADQISSIALYLILGTASLGIAYLILIIIGSIIGATLEAISDYWSTRFSNLMDYFSFEDFLLVVNILCLICLLYFLFERYNQ